MNPQPTDTCAVPIPYLLHLVDYMRNCEEKIEAGKDVRLETIALLGYLAAIAKPWRCCELTEKHEHMGMGNSDYKHVGKADEMFMKLMEEQGARFVDAGYGDCKYCDIHELCSIHAKDISE